jgi:hypothetical protein
VKPDNSDHGGAAYAWGLETGTRLTTTLIAACFAGLVARVLWPEPLATGWTAYVFGLLYLAAALEAIMELTSGFTWQDGMRYARGGLLGVAVLLYLVL